MSKLTVREAVLYAFAMGLFGCNSGDAIDTDECGPKKACPVGESCVSGKCESGAVGSLRLTLQTTGMGSIEIAGKTTCTMASCTADFMTGATASLTAKPAAGWTFVAWGGDCSGSTAATSVMMTAARTCSATFRQADQTSYAVTITAETGGAITGTGLTCAGQSCTGRITTGSEVTLSASPQSGYRFAGWSGTGGCEGATTPLTLAIAAEVSCTARFTQVYTVSATAVGAPATVTVSAGSCTAASCLVDKNTDAVLTAGPLAGYRFSEWSGGALCAGKIPTLTVRVISALACQANYVKRFTVTGLIAGDLPGTITATPSETTSACGGASCVADEGSAVTLLASSIPGYRLAGWTGAGCAAGTVSGSGLTIKPTADITCTASFVAGVAVSGTVVGAEDSITATATGTNVMCSPGQCSLDAGGTVTLQAHDLAPGFRFTGWSGDAGCTGTELKLVIASVQTSVSCKAVYVRRLTVTGAVEAGLTGTVSVTSVSPFKRCTGGSACTVDEKAAVTVKAPVISGQRFVRWLGVGCEGSEPEITVMPEGDDVACIADYATGVTVSGIVSGATATVAASSVSDGADCTAGSACTLDSGGTVKLQAMDLAPAYRFVGWSGDAGCTGATREITLKDVDSDRTCTATYKKRVTVTASAGTTGGAVSIAPEDPNQVCDVAAGTCVVDEGTSVSLDVTAPAGYRFDEWKGDAACDGKGDDPLVFAAAEVTCTATFVQQFTVSVSPVGTTAPVTVSFGGCSAASCPVDKDGTATLAAVDNPGDAFRFKSWGGDCSGATATITVVVTRPLACTAIFVQRFTITASAPAAAAPPTLTPADENAVCDSDSCETDTGTKVTLVAGSYLGKRLDKWTGPGCTGTVQGNGITVTVTANVTCTAEYVDGVSVSGAIVGGDGVSMVTATGDGVCGAGRCTLEPGGNVKLLAPDLMPQYRFKGWSGDAGCTGIAFELNFTNVQTSIACKATYVARVTVGATVNPGEGTLDVSSAAVPHTCDTAAHTCTVDLGAVVTLKVTLPGGRRFLGWKNGSASCGSSNPLDITASVDLTCMAQSALTITVAAVATGGASPMLKAVSTSPGANCSAGSSCTLDEGGDVNLSTQDLKPDYRFLGWSGDPGCTATATNFSITLNDVPASRTCKADYINRHHVVGAIQSGVTVEADDIVQVIATTGNPDCGGTQNNCYVDTGTAVQLIAPSVTGYRFSGWSTGCSNMFTPTGDITCTASYIKQWKIEARDGTNGKGHARVAGQATDCAMQSCVVDQGTVVNLSSEADAHYDFDKWTPTSCSPVASDPLPLSNVNATCTPTFKKEIYAVTGAAKPTAAGRVGVSYSTTCVDQTTCNVPYNDTATLAASANAGYKFWKWENCGGGTASSITVMPDAAITCTALFRVVLTGTTNSGTVSGAAGSVDGSCSAAATTVSCTVPQNTSATFTVSPAAGAELTGWSGPCTANGNVATLAMVGAPGTCAATYFSRWAKSYGIADNDEDTTGLVLTRDGAPVIAGSSGGTGRTRLPHALLLKAQDGKATFSNTFSDDEGGSINGVRAVAVDDVGPVLLLNGPQGIPSVARLDNQLGHKETWSLTFAQSGLSLVGETGVDVCTGQGGLRASSTLTTQDDRQVQTTVLRLSYIDGTSQARDHLVCEGMAGAACAAGAGCVVQQAGPIADFHGNTIVSFRSTATQRETVVVASISAAGQVVWKKRFWFANHSSITPRGIIVGPTNFVVVGEVSNGQTTDGFYAMYEAESGKEITGAVLETAGNDTLRSGVVDSNGRYLVAGTTPEPGSENIDDVWLVRIAANGGSVEQLAFGGANPDMGAGVVVLPNKDVVLAGNTLTFGTPGDHWAMLLSDKLDIVFNQNAPAAHRKVTTAKVSAGFTPSSIGCVVTTEGKHDVRSVKLSAAPAAVIETRQAP